MELFALEDDEDTLAAVLAFLEDGDAPTGGPHCSSLPPRARDGGVHSVAGHPPPSTCLHQPSKAAKTNRNGAREKRQREIKQLQIDALALETQVQTLRAAAAQRMKWPQRPSAENAAGTRVEAQESSVMASEWKELASRQLDQLVAAERENNRLKMVQEEQHKLMQALGRVLRTRLAQRVLKACNSQDKRTRRVHAVPIDNSDAAVFHELERGVDDVHREALALLRTGRRPDGVTPGGAYAEKTLPFDLRATADAAWRCLTQSRDLEKRRSSYQRDPRSRSQPFAGDDTVLESFGSELHTQQMTADFQIKQVFRRYVETDRVVIAWRSFIDPVRFKGEAVSGVRFLENGTAVISTPSDGGPFGKRSFVRTWFTTTVGRLPRHAGASDHESGFDNMRELTDFVPNGSSSGNAVQMIENLLLEQTIAGKAS